MAEAASTAASVEMQNLLLLPVDALISHGAKRQREECECVCESLPSALGPHQTRLATPRDAHTVEARRVGRTRGEALLSKAHERHIVEDAVKSLRGGGARLVRAARRGAAQRGFGFTVRRQRTLRFSGAWSWRSVSVDFQFYRTLGQRTAEQLSS